MAISANYVTSVLTIPQADLTLVSGTLYELDAGDLHDWLKDLEDSEEHMPKSDTHIHTSEITLSGVTYARFVEIIAPWSLEFEDGAYTVNVVGGNTNVGDPAFRVENQVSVVANNSAGLVSQTEIIKYLRNNRRITTVKETIYEEDGTTVFKEWDLEDKDGNPIDLRVGDPAARLID